MATKQKSYVWQIADDPTVTSVDDFWQRLDEPVPGTDLPPILNLGEVADAMLWVYVRTHATNVPDPDDPRTWYDTDADSGDLD